MKAENVTAAGAPEPLGDAPIVTADELERYGITAHQKTTYEWNRYRYSNRSDALAAAKRAARPTL